MRPSRPNIVMIICHDLGQYCGCYGAGVSTPNIDALAADGVRFNNYHCSAAQCSPSRGSIMTGLYPHNNGLVGLAHIGWEINPGVRTLPMYLRELGYSTHLFGVQHEASGDPLGLGYERVEAEGSKACELSAALVEWLRQRASIGGDSPFFVNLGTGEAHRPYAQEDYRVDDPDGVALLPWLPDRPGIREDIAHLNGLVYALDETVGDVRVTLDDTGLADNTLLLFTTDHGLAMPRAKGTCYDPGTKTALVMRRPGRWDNGSVHDELLTNCDLLPTLVEFAGGQAPTGIDGRSFLGLLDWAESYVPREDIFIEMTWHDRYNPMRCVRTNRFKYIRNFGDRPLVYLPLDVWNGPAGQAVCDEYYAVRRPAEELYDLVADPLEMNNLASDPAYRSVLAKLRGRVDRWMHETNDRLLKGDWPPTPKQAERERQGPPN